MVFGHASLGLVAAEQRPRIELRPPAQRGDLGSLLSRPPATAVLLDGLFGAALAPTVMECAQLLRAGWRLIGAASMGALRAAELWSMGMIGIGDVYLMLRLGVVDADDEVAVAYHPDTLEELTASLVHVRAVVARTCLPRPECAARLLDAARSIYWMERSWHAVLAAWKTMDIGPALLAEMARTARSPVIHPKNRDAVLAIRAVLADVWVPGDYAGDATCPKERCDA